MAWHDIIEKLLAKLTPQLKVDIKHPVIINNLNIHITNNSHDQDVSYDPGKEICKINLEKLLHRLIHFQFSKNISIPRNFQLSKKMIVRHPLNLPNFQSSKK